MMTVHEKLYTAEDLWNLSADDSKHYELIEGELVEMSPTGEEHGVIMLWLGSLIMNHVQANQLGRALGAETGFKLFQNPDTVLAPDIAFTSNERLKPTTVKFAFVAPDLAVEIVSPSNTADEINKKAQLFFKAGTRLLWVVYPRTETIHVYRTASEIIILDIDDTLDGGNVLPGFAVPVKEIFSVLGR
jgi:Uma2 family endonuclease